MQTSTMDLLVCQNIMHLMRTQEKDICTVYPIHSTLFYRMENYSEYLG